MSLRSGIVSYGPSTDTSGFLNVRVLNFGQHVRGLDWFHNNDEHTYSFAGDLQTGEIKIGDPSRKFCVYEVNVRMYCDEGTAAADLPDVIVMGRGLQDDDWTWMGDKNGAITIGTPSAPTPDQVIFSTGAFWPLQCRFYRDTALLKNRVDYEVTGVHEITLERSLDVGETLHCYTDSPPYPMVAIGDYIWTGEAEFTRITAINANGSLTLSRVPDNVTTPRHVKAAPCPQAGESIVRYPLRGIWDVLQLRIVTVPRISATAPVVVKVIGVDIVTEDAGPRQLRT